MKILVKKPVYINSIDEKFCTTDCMFCRVLSLQTGNGCCTLFYDTQNHCVYLEQGHLPHYSYSFKRCQDCIDYENETID
jgi:hypothetical protein